MKDMVDYIKYHGTISSIRDKVDKDYIWFDICQKKTYKDINGGDKVNLSFFSARMYIEYSNKINLSIRKDVYVRGIPKGYVDKKGYRQNYIHVLEINGIEISKESPLYQDGYWNGKKIEKVEATKEKQEELQRLLDEIVGVRNE